MEEFINIIIEQALTILGVIGFLFFIYLVGHSFNLKETIKTIRYDRELVRRKRHIMKIAEKFAEVWKEKTGKYIAPESVTTKAGVILNKMQQTMWEEIEKEVEIKIEKDKTHKEVKEVETIMIEVIKKYNQGCSGGGNIPLNPYFLKIYHSEKYLKFLEEVKKIKEEEGKTIEKDAEEERDEIIDMIVVGLVKKYNKDNRTYLPEKLDTLKILYYRKYCKFLEEAKQKSERLPKPPAFDI